jgi:hypothetical protein
MWALDVLDNTNDGPNENEDTRRVQRPHMLAPWVLVCHRTSSGVRSHALLEDERTNQEEAEEDDLHDEAADDNVLAGAC